MNFKFKNIICFNNFNIKKDLFKNSIKNKIKIEKEDLIETELIFGIEINKVKINNKYLCEIINELDKIIIDKKMKSNELYLDIFYKKESDFLTYFIEDSYELKDMKFYFFNFTTGLILLTEIKYKGESIFNAKDFFESRNENITYEEYLSYTSVKGRDLLSFEYDLINNNNVYIDLLVQQINSNNLTFLISLHKDTDHEKIIKEYENFLNNNLNVILKHGFNFFNLEYFEDENSKKIHLLINFKENKLFELMDIFELMNVSKIIFKEILFELNEEKIIMLNENKKIIILEAD